jgi:hypothetical protein
VPPQAGKPQNNPGLIGLKGKKMEINIVQGVVIYSTKKLAEDFLESYV